MTVNSFKTIIIFGVVVAVMVVMTVAVYFAGKQAGPEFDLISEDLQKIKQANLLTPEGLLIRQELIKPLGNKPGVVIETKEFTVIYLSAPDQFEAEIKVEQAESAKNDVVSWLKSRGLGESDICALPIVFNLEFSVSQKFKSEGVGFKRLPDFCEELLGTS
jgi:hypothetical protein